MAELLSLGEAAEDSSNATANKALDGGARKFAACANIPLGRSEKGEALLSVIGGGYPPSFDVGRGFGFHGSREESRDRARTVECLTIS
jgi:hypothetical protein